MFGEFLWDHGVEMELDAELDQVLKVVDGEVPTFSCDNHRYQVAVTKGVLGSQWRFLVYPVDNETREPSDTPVGHVIVTRQEEKTLFQIPPRSEWTNSPDLDVNGRLFTAFVLQILEAFERMDWIELEVAVPEIR